MLYRAPSAAPDHTQAKKPSRYHASSYISSAMFGYLQLHEPTPATSSSSASLPMICEMEADTSYAMLAPPHTYTWQPAQEATTCCICHACVKLVSCRYQVCVMQVSCRCHSGVM